MDIDMDNGYGYTFRICCYTLVFVIQMYTGIEKWNINLKVIGTISIFSENENVTSKPLVLFIPTFI